MLDARVYPESRITFDKTELLLGMHLTACINVLKAADNHFHQVTLGYHETRPLDNDIVVSLTQDGLRLLFSPGSQRLRVIQVSELSKLKLRYMEALFNAPDVPPTYAQIDRSFGCTKPGEYDVKKNTVIINYRGIAFAFRLPHDNQVVYHSSAQVPPEIPPDCWVSALYIYSGVHPALAEEIIPQSALSRPRSEISHGKVTVGFHLPQGIQSRKPHHTGPASERSQRRHSGSTKSSKKSSPREEAGNVSKDSIPSEPAASGSERVPPNLFGPLNPMSSNLRESVNSSGARGDVPAVTVAVHFVQSVRGRRLSSGSPKNSAKASEVHKALFGFGSTSQEVRRKLGDPCRAFYKEDYKTKIHSGSVNAEAAAKSSDYFYNYFTLGMDVLFDGRSHTAKKFVLHTNIPGHYSFTIYERCEFEVYLSKDLCQLTKDFMVTPVTKWSEIEELLKSGDENRTPLVLNRTPSLNSTNPFGATHAFGVHDFIFEVMKNGHIESVTVCAFPVTT